MKVVKQSQQQSKAYYLKKFNMEKLIEYLVDRIKFLEDENSEIKSSKLVLEPLSPDEREMLEKLEKDLLENQSIYWECVTSDFAYFIEGDNYKEKERTGDKVMLADISGDEFTWRIEIGDAGEELRCNRGILFKRV